MRTKALLSGRLVPPHYSCETHTEYRRYQDELLKFANWCVLVVAVLTVPVIWPLSAVGSNLNINLIPIFTFCGIIINSATVPLGLGIAWPGANSVVLIAGCLGGSAVGGRNVGIMECLKLQKTV